MKDNSMNKTVAPKNKINRNVKILSVALLLICLVNIAFIKSAFAHEHGEVTLTVRQVFKNNGATAPLSETFSYRLTPESATYPMPASETGGGAGSSDRADGSEGDDGVELGNSGGEIDNTGGSANDYTFTITGTNDVLIGPISFTRAGEYSYKLSHITGTRPGYTYDNEVYTLDIIVMGNLSYNVIAYKRDGSKAANIRYEHSYERKISPGSQEPNVILPIEPEPTEEPTTGGVLPYRREKNSQNAINGEIRPLPTDEPAEEQNRFVKNRSHWEFNDGNRPGDWPHLNKHEIIDVINIDIPPRAGDDSPLEIYIVLFGLAGITAIGSVIYLLVLRRRGKAGRRA